MLRIRSPAPDPKKPNGNVCAHTQVHSKPSTKNGIKITSHIESIPAQHSSYFPSGKFKTSSRIISIASTVKNNPNSSIPNRLSDDHHDGALNLEPAYVEFVSETSLSNGKLKNSPNPIKRWLSERDTYLDEVLRQEGRGEFTNGICVDCNSAPGVYRCSDCFGSEMMCRQCILKSHARNPLHLIQVWQDHNFNPVTLKRLGLRIQLGHRLSERCLNPSRAPNDDFTILHINGIHNVGLDYCNCETAKPHYIQLLRYRLWPASVTSPKTGATLTVLKFFQMLNFESKASHFEFYSTLARLTDNTGTSTPNDRYRSFLTIIHEYRHVKMLKRAGRGHAISKVSGTQPGECAVLCPACPQPGINFTADTCKKPHLNRLYLAIDANFKLKRRPVSSEAADPGLGSGWSYFVPEEAYKGYLEKFWDQIAQNRSNCSNHNAVNKDRSGVGLAATGVGAVDCARHDMKRPLSIGDLQKGERYVNMDYLFFSSLRNSSHSDVVVSYDIGCQWSVNLWSRMKQYPVWMHIANIESKSFLFLIPKFHLPAHIMACQSIYSFNYNPHVGRTDGEAPERGWAQINSISVSTREMGPGRRRDTLDDHFGDGNWKKTTLMGVSLLRKIKEAVLETHNHKFQHNQFVLGLPSGSIKGWEESLRYWELDRSAPNPFEKKYKTVSLNDVRKRLATEEAEQMALGTAHILHDEISASQLLILGLELEDQQRRLAVDLKSIGPHTTDEQRARVQVRINVLQRKIQSWIEVEHLYIPGLHAYRDLDANHMQSSSPNLNVTEVPVHDTKLYLPSAIDPGMRVACDLRLRQLEWDLRYAQAHDSLQELRDALRLRSYVYKDKDRFQQGQWRNTRSRGIINRLEVKVTAAASKYRVARLALKSLAPHLLKVGWDQTFLPLKDTDIVGLKDTSNPTRKQNLESEGRREVSWIWKRLGDDVQNSDESLQEDLRIEFCKSKARADRWQEEVEILEEEMSRVKRFFIAHSQFWRDHAESAEKTFSGGDSTVIEGIRAFATQQSLQYHKMLTHCEHLWHRVKGYIKSGEGDVFITGHVQDDEGLDSNTCE